MSGPGSTLHLHLVSAIDPEINLVHIISSELRAMSRELMLVANSSWLTANSISSALSFYRPLSYAYLSWYGCLSSCVDHERANLYDGAFHDNKRYPANV